MLKHIKASQLKPLLKEYLDGGDFSKPFIVAGWTAVGKTTIVKETLDEVFGERKGYLKPLSPKGLAAFEQNPENEKYPYLSIGILFEADTKAEMKEYLQFIRSNHNKPIIIEQTYQDEDTIEELGLQNDVFVVDFDREEWLQWLHLTKGLTAHKLLSTLPLEQIHAGYLPESSILRRSMVKPSPRKWAKIAKQLDSFSASLHDMPEENREAVINAIKTFLHMN